MMGSPNYKTLLCPSFSRQFIATLAIVWTTSVASSSSGVSTSVHPTESEVFRNVDSTGRIQEAEADASLEEEDAEVTTHPPAPAEQLLELILEAHAARVADEPLPKTIDGVVIARVLSVDASGLVRVAYPGAPSDGAPARAMTRVTTNDIGRDAALLFEDGDREKPLVMGLLFQGQAAPIVTAQTAARVTLDEERVVLSAEREIVLECGEASITLTRAGKILIKGTYVLTRSSGTNRIQGGSVQIN